MEKKTPIDTPWNAETIYALGLYRRISQVLGIWPLNSQNIVSTCIMLLACITQVTMIIEIAGEMIIKASGIDPQNMSLISCNFLVFIKILMIRFNRGKMQEVIDTLVGAWNNEANEKALEVMKRSARLGRSICIYQLGTTYFVTIPMILGALVSSVPTVNRTINDRELILRSYPIQTPYFFANVPTWLYWVVFIYQSVQLIATCTGNVGVDCCFFGIAMNLTGQIECLTLEFNKLEANPGELSMQDDLPTIIRRHNHLTKLAEHLEGTFNFIILCIVTANVSQVCFYGIQLIRCIRDGNIVIAVNTFICIALLNFQIFLYSWAGDRISSMMEELRIAAFNSPWYDMPLKNRRDLIFIMMRTSQIFALTAGKIYRMDLDSFKNIIKAIGSYFSVMQAMFEE